jgi:hypothetical protein
LPFCSAAYLSAFTKCFSDLFAKLLSMAHLPAQDVVIELCSDGLSAGNLPNMLAKLLSTWDPVLGSEPVWYVQVALYEKHSSYGVLVIHHTYYAAPSASFNDGIGDAAH